jgi:hypothetical protein
MAELGDHVLRSRDIAVVGFVASEGGTDQAAALLGRLGPTGGADRRSAAFFGQRGFDANFFEAVAQGIALVGTCPTTGPAVLLSPRGLSLDPGGVADHGQAYMVSRHEVRGQVGGPVAGQLHHPAVLGLGFSLRPGQLPPPTGTGPASLAGLGPQGAPLGGHLPLTGFLVFQVQELLGPDGAARDQ